MAMTVLLVVLLVLQVLDILTSFKAFELGGGETNKRILRIRQYLGLEGALLVFKFCAMVLIGLGLTYQASLPGWTLAVVLAVVVWYVRVVWNNVQVIRVLRRR